MTDELNMIYRHETDRRLQGLSGVGIECPYSSWSLGGSKTRMEASASKDTPLATTGFCAFLSTSVGPFFFNFSFFPCFRPTCP